MPNRKRPTFGEMHKAIDEWNAKHAPRTRVRYWPGARTGDGKIGETTTQATILGDHTAGVFVANAGFIALTHVEAL